MNTREQFGKYLLLKKLAEDRLGETFRAGKLGAAGMERVALLRVFNGQGLDSQRLWDAAHRRAALQQALHSPNIGEGIEVGEVQGIPFVAYDYVSGKNLATLCEQAAKKQSHIPTEHALLITERIALALAAASEHRYDDERILHGFVVPHLVMISNEGETRLLGFEVGPGLRGFVTNPVIRQYFGRYLSPEALAGAPLGKSDDIYSLGVILFELLTGKPLPPPAADGYGSIIAQARMAADGAPLADELKGLLGRSLVAREQRIADAATWHKALNRWMFEGQYNPTTFNLAFFMHNLFRQEIERESQEIEIEKTLPLPVQAPPPPPVAAAPPVRETTGVREVTGVREGSGVRTGTGTGVREMTGTYAGQPPKSSKTGLMAAVAVLVLAVGAGGYFYLSSKKGAEGGPNPADPQALAAGAETPVEPPPPAGSSPEEVQAKIDEMITARADALEEELRGHYDQQLKELQTQLDQAQKEKKDREELLAKQRQAEEERKRREAEAAQQAETERKRVEEEATKKEAEEAAAKLAAKEAAPPPPPVAPPPKPAAPQVRRGDLVEPGPGVVPPKLERQAAARFPEMARKVGKNAATVTVRVLVDENGKVIDTKQVDKAGFGFDAEALAVAKKSTFTPATKNGVPVKMWIDFKVGFKG